MKNISSLYDKIAEMHNVTPETVSKIESNVFAYIANHMKERLPGTILIHNFGTLCPSLKKTNRQIRKELYKYRRGPLTKEEITERVSKLWVLRNEALKRTEND